MFPKAPMDHQDSIPTRLQGMWKARVVCSFLGFGSLLSWNSILSLGDYYYDSFPHYHPTRVLPLVYQPSELLALFVLAYNLSKVNTRNQILFGYIVFCLSTLALLLIEVFPFGKGGIVAYSAICVFVAAFGVANAFVQGGVVGDIAFMSPDFLQSFSAGLAASGALTSILRIITKAAFDQSKAGLRKGAMLFLAISTLFAFLCIFLYAFVFGKLAVVKHFRDQAASAEILLKVEDSEAEQLSMTQLMRMNADYELDLFLVYALTLSIVPGFLYENTGTHRLGSWYAIVLITVYNVCDLVGRYVPLVRCIKLESRVGLVIASVSRLLFVPCFYYTAKYGDQGWMIMLVCLLGLTNGYLTVCVLTTAPKGYRAPEQNALGNLLVVFIAVGIFSGVGLSWFWVIT